MKLFRKISLCLIFVPVGISAQALEVSEEQVRRCFVETPLDTNFPQCVGDASNDCQLHPDGTTTGGIRTCILAEKDIWDAILNEEYETTMATFNEIGGEDLKVTLRDAQRAWIVFRDAECAMRLQRQIQGTIRSLVYAACLETMTAERAIAMRNLRDVWK